MYDRITNLCRKLLRAEEPAEVHPVAEELRSAIAEKVDQLRADAQDIALKLLHEPEKAHPQTQSVTMEADHVHRPQNERPTKASVA
jgi:hypothetical protein